jgi:hypothetical protein
MPPEGRVIAHFADAVVFLGENHRLMGNHSVSFLSLALVLKGRIIVRWGILPLCLSL